MRNKKKGTWMMTGGLLLMAAALFLTCYNYWDERRATASAEGILQEMPPEILSPAEPAVPETEDPGEIEIPDYILDPKMEMPTVEIDGGTYIGVVKIPSLGVELPVMSEWNDPNLKIAPCRYCGSAYLGDLIIAGHNYRSHFGSLKNVQVDDEVLFTDVDGNVFRYTVAEIDTVNGSDVEGMQAGDWDLTLFTCTYGGKSRVTVRCVLTAEE